MKSYCSTERSTLLFLLCFIFSGIMPVAEPIFGSGPAGRAGRPLSSSERSAYEDRKALEAYEKRNAEIDSWIEENSIPDYKNAALLYYQALLLKPDHDQTVINKFYDVYGGVEPDTQIRTYLGEWLPSMKVSEIASRIPQCTWGAWSEPTFDLHFLNAKLRPLIYVIAADAITLAYDGHCRAGLERCMTLRRIARHLSHDSKLHMSSSAFDGIALRTIRRILGEMPLDADVLAWFQGQLAMFHEATPFLERVLQEYLKAKIGMVQSSSIVSLRAMLLKIAADEQARQNIRDLTDVQIRSRAIEAVRNLFGSIFAILHSNKSAEQKKAEIEEVNKDFYASPNKDIIKSLMNIYNELGKEIVSLITGMDNEITEEQKLSEMQKIIDKLAEPNAIELLTKFSNALGKEIDFGFLADSEMTDEQRLAEMQKAICELSEAYTIETSRFGFSWNWIDRLFKSQVSHTAQINSIKAAVEVYLVVAKTGKLPEKLPDYLPKDPYSGQDFEYETTKEGFVLRCRAKDIDSGKIQQYEFKVQK